MPIRLLGGALLLLGLVACGDPEPPAAPPPKVPDQNEGWRDLKWGDPPPEDCKPIHGEGDHTWCERPSEPKTVGGLTDASVSYDFWKGQLESVTVKARGTDEGKRLIEGMITTYGRGEEIGPAQMFWSGQKVWMAFAPLPDGSGMIAIYRDKALGDQRKAGEEAAKKAGGL